MRARCGVAVTLLAGFSALGWAQAAAEYGVTASKTGAATAAAGRKIGSAKGSAMRSLGTRLAQATDGSGNKPAPSKQAAPGPVVIELGKSASAARTPPPTQPLKPAVFVLADGKRFEARTYTITKDFVYFVAPTGANGKVPVGSVNVPATISANRERGIDMKFPGANEVTLSF